MKITDGALVHCVDGAKEARQLLKESVLRNYDTAVKLLLRVQYCKWITFKRSLRTKLIEIFKLILDVS
jgi:hypothetical protein